MDLLNLARTGKHLRNTLMRRSGISVWKAVRATVKGLPECPSDLSEPQYANLMFDMFCHVRRFISARLTDSLIELKYCGTARTPTIIWSNWSRCCGKCNEEKLLCTRRLKTFALISSTVVSLNTWIYLTYPRTSSPSSRSTFVSTVSSCELIHWEPSPHLPLSLQ